jgi:hypothetical protein
LGANARQARNIALQQFEFYSQLLACQAVFYATCIYLVCCTNLLQIRGLVGRQPGSKAVIRDIMHIIHAVMMNFKTPGAAS